MQFTKPDETGVTVDVIHTASISSLAKIKKYYNKSSNLLTTATVLDPRLKLLFYKDHQRGELFKDVSGMYKEYQDRVPFADEANDDGNETDDSDVIMKKFVIVKDELKSYCDNVY